MGVEIINREVHLDSKKEVSPLIVKFFDEMLYL